MVYPYVSAIVRIKAARSRADANTEAPLQNIFA